MSIFLFYNNAASTLAGPISNTATTINLAAGGGAQFTPPPAGGQLFCMTLIDAATGLLREIIHVTAVTGDVLTVVRAQEGTTALNWLAGDIISNEWTAGSAAQMLQQGQLPGTIIYVAGADTGTANNIVVATSPVISVISTGNIIEVTKGSLANTGAVTIQQNGASAVAVTWANGTPLANGDWPASATGLISYQAGGTFQLITFTSSSSPNLVHYGVASGTANALTVTFSPQITALTDGLLFEVVPYADNTGATTINPNGLGAVAFAYANTAALAGGELIAGVPVLAMSKGGEFLLLGASGSANSIANAYGYKNLLATNSGGSPNTIINVTADSVLGIPSFSATINSAVSGAGGVDTGAVAASTSYDLYAGYNPATGATTAWMTVEGNAPTIPAGYIAYRRIAWQRTDSSYNFLRIIQHNDHWQYVVVTSSNTPSMVPLWSGSLGSWDTNAAGSYAAVSLVGLAPVKSVSVKLVISVSGYTDNGLSVAPNNDYTSYEFALVSNPPYTTGSAYGAQTQVDLLLETASTIYGCSQSNVGCLLSGGTISI